MRNKKTDAQLILSDDIVARDIVFYEHNLFKWPLFFINKKDAGSQKIINITITTDNGDGYWRVSPNVEYGAGGPFDDAVLTVLQKIISSLSRPISNPIDVGTLTSFTKQLGIKSHGGADFEKIKKSLKRLTSLLISSKFTFYDKGNKMLKREHDGVFHVIDKVIFIGEDRDGIKSEKNLVWLNQNLLANINAGYVNSLDLDFYWGLKDTERAIFKFLSVRFFANRHNPNPVRVRYSTLCNLTTISRRTQLSTAKQQLNGAHDSLLKKGFLKYYEWADISNEKHDWIIFYEPGHVAEAHIKNRPKPALSLHGEHTEGAGNKRHITQDISLFTTEKHYNINDPDKKAVYDKLFKLGILKDEAEGIAFSDQYSPTFINDALLYCELKSAEKGTILKPQYIIKVIKQTSHDYILQCLDDHKRKTISRNKREDTDKLKQQYMTFIAQMANDKLSTLEESEVVSLTTMARRDARKFCDEGSAAFDEMVAANINERVCQKYCVVPDFKEWVKTFKV